jgi:hypothetical protein
LPAAQEGGEVMEDFAQKAVEAAGKAILKLIGDGAWIMPDYANRFKLPPAFIDEVWQLVDKDRLRHQIAQRIELELAERMVNHMAAELATDIKQILSVPERREALRAVAREHMQAVMKAGPQP